MATAYSRSTCDAAIVIDDLALSPTDVSGSANMASVRATKNVGTYWKAYQDHPTRYVLYEDATVDLTVLYSSSTSDAFGILREWADQSVTDSAARTVNVRMIESGTYQHNFYGEMILTSFEFTLTAGEGGPVLVSVSLQSSGEFHIGASSVI